MEFLSRLSKKERRLFYITVAVVAIVFLERVVFKPVMNKLENFNGKISLEEKKLEKSMHILGQESAITSEYEKFAQSIKQEQSDEETLAILLSSIEKMANSVSVFILDMKPGTVEKAEFYKKYTVKIEAEAKISNLTDFIYQLENSPKLLRVSDFRLTPQKKETVLKISMTVTEVLIN
ncbi:MAG: type 4a pilus biogenesis protein PilO [Candidatus Omnitrophica bacterium]|jgi:Tfp pilus assembly protein PilO|nr:type 4a pilus biogenesis protein PilO [Candidatus Omnitrophota bacterium]MDD5691164.1 type 4a pilus biogenesis protein PilO [Candidatus Omnitrophota bacterium]